MTSKSRSLPARIWSHAQYIASSLRFLLRTRATFRCFTNFLFWDLFEREALAKHRGAQQAFREQVRTMDFSRDWFSLSIPFWEELALRYRLNDKAEIRALEIGCWEGMSSLYMLQRHPRLHLTCVDTWMGGDEHQLAEQESPGFFSEVEQRFDANLQAHATRITKYKGTSQAYFAHHRADSVFDLIYIDGSHHSDDVIVDAVRGFEMLKVGGLVIFDDYLWNHYLRASDNPAGAINAFLRLHEGDYRIAAVYGQIALEKTRNASRPPCTNRP